MINEILISLRIDRMLADNEIRERNHQHWDLAERSLHHDGVHGHDHQRVGHQGRAAQLNQRQQHGQLVRRRVAVRQIRRRRRCVSVTFTRHRVL